MVELVIRRNNLLSFGLLVTVRLHMMAHGSWVYIKLNSTSKGTKDHAGVEFDI